MVAARASHWAKLRAHILQSLQPGKGGSILYREVLRQLQRKWPKATLLRGLKAQLRGVPKEEREVWGSQTGDRGLEFPRRLLLLLLSCFNCLRLWLL